MMEMEKVEFFREFYEEVGEKYPEEEIVYRTLKGRLRREFILKHLASWKGRLLDVGCNRGMYLKAYRGGKKVGVDISLPVLEKIWEAGENMPLVVADAQVLDCFRDEVFDVVLCSEVLEHVPRPERVMEGMHKVLAPGGRAFITTPNYRGKRPEWAEIGMMGAYGIQGVRGNRYWHTAYRPEELAGMGTKFGFHVVEKGTLEKEVKYAAKIPMLVFYLFYIINRWMLRSRRWDALNQRMFDALSLGIYRLVKGVGLNSLLLRWIREGVRSYIIIEKPSP
jgi:2-polyprenyl-6-hydroxyphenyl methylase/3-demethylubiquinone-9 3-methyltransferase